MKILAFSNQMILEHNFTFERRSVGDLIIVLNGKMAWLVEDPFIRVAYSHS